MGRAGPGIPPARRKIRTSGRDRGITSRRNDTRGSRSRYWGRFGLACL